MDFIKGFFKPVPILPKYSAFIGFAFTLYGQIHFKERHDAIAIFWLSAALKGLITSAALYFPAILVVKFVSKSTSTLKKYSSYYLGVALISWSYTCSQAIIEPILFQNTPKLFGLINLTYIHNLVPIFFSISITGYLFRKLHREIEEKILALEMIQAQNHVLIEAEESSRATISNFLHDRVQASLVTVNMQIAAINKELPTVEREKLNSVIAELEYIRAVEVRDAATGLNPNLSVVGLLSALKTYSDSFNTTTTTKIMVDKSADSWLIYRPAKEQVLLGIYRIAQQVVLNAVVHGRAKNIEIKIEIPEPSMLVLTIANNGLPIANEVKPGTGTAKIEGWNSILKSNSVTFNLAGEVVFKLDLPI